MNNISLVFEAESSLFDSTSQYLSVAINITWLPPQRLNGIFANYSVTLQSSASDAIYEVTGMDEEVRATVSVKPFELYSVTVIAVTGGGNSTATSDMVRSPEAGKAKCPLPAFFKTFFSFLFLPPALCLIFTPPPLFHTCF